MEKLGLELPDLAQPLDLELPEPGESERPAARTSSISTLELDPGDRVPVGDDARRYEFGKYEHRSTGALSAVVELDGSRVGTNQLVGLAATYLRISHPAVLGLVGFIPGTVLCGPRVVFEWPGRGSLAQAIGNPEVYDMLTATQKSKIIIGIVRGMRHIHAAAGPHYHLRSSSILLDSNWEPRIAGFGLARWQDPMSDDGLIPYLAPELLNADAGPPADIYSFAMIWWEITTGRLVRDTPFAQARSVLQLVRRIQQGTRPSLDGVNSFAELLIRECWGGTPEDRPSWEDIEEALILNGYGFVGSVDGNAIEEYITRIEESEGH
jgi:hypothetical protein